jgi:hypothetical protein
LGALVPEYSVVIAFSAAAAWSHCPSSAPINESEVKQSNASGASNEQPSNVLSIHRTCVLQSPCTLSKFNPCFSMQTTVLV